MTLVASATEQKSRSDDELDAAAHCGKGATKRLVLLAATPLGRVGLPEISAWLVDDDIPEHHLFPRALPSPRKTYLQPSSYFRNETLSLQRTGTKARPNIAAVRNVKVSPGIDNQA